MISNAASGVAPVPNSNPFPDAKARMTEDAKPAPPPADRSRGWMSDPRVGVAALAVSVVALGLSAAPWLGGSMKAWILAKIRACSAIRSGLSRWS